jgi:peroxiredoxin
MRSFLLLLSILLTLSVYAQDENEERLNRYQQMLKQSQELVSKPAPDFTVKDLDGNVHDLSKYRGKTVVLNFWYIGCAPCRKEIPDLNNLIDEYKDKDVVFIALATDSKKKLKSFLKRKPFNYNIVASARDVASDYSVLGYPTNIVIDKNGRIAFSKMGYGGDSTALESAIKTAVN